MPSHSDLLVRMRKELEAQNRDWQRCCEQLAVLGDVQFHIPKARLDEIDDAFETRIATFQTINPAYGARA
jgi:hypothetical protein